MKISIKRLDQDLPVPEYKTPGAVGFDLYLRNNEKVRPKEIIRIPANIIVKIPFGYLLLINGRSSTPIKHGLLVFPGVVDSDYCGDNDELNIQVMNLTSKTVNLEKGSRIAQGILVAIAKAEFKQVKKMAKKSRGGFGTTG